MYTQYDAINQLKSFGYKVTKDFKYVNRRTPIKGKILCSRCNHPKKLQKVTNSPCHICSAEKESEKVYTSIKNLGYKLTNNFKYDGIFSKTVGVLCKHGHNISSRWVLIKKKYYCSKCEEVSSMQSAIRRLNELGYDTSKLKTHMKASITHGLTCPKCNNINRAMLGRILSSGACSSEECRQYKIKEAKTLNFTIPKDITALYVTTEARYLGNYEWEGLTCKHCGERVCLDKSSRYSGKCPKCNRDSKGKLAIRVVKKKSKNIIKYEYLNQQYELAKSCVNISKVTRDYKNKKLNIVCDKGHKITVKCLYPKQGRYGCTMCLRSALKEEVNLNIVKSYKLRQERLRDNGWICSDEEIKYSSQISVKCTKCKKNFNETFNNMVKRKFRCMQCFPSYISMGEERVKEILNKISPNYIQHYRAEFLGTMSIDFLFKKKGNVIAIEYQGEQHYRSVRFNGSSGSDVVSQKKRDRRKRYLCKREGIHLICIPFYIKNLESYIKRRVSLLCLNQTIKKKRD